MRILFIHQNFPGQFPHLAAALVARGHDVVALTADSKKRATSIRTVRYPWAPRQIEFEQFHFATTYARMSNRAECVARAAQKLKTGQNYAPDLVIGHPGWGETLYLKEVWPETPLLAYAEFFYRTRNLDVDFDPEFGTRGLDHAMWVASRTAHLLQSVVAADRLLAPTRFQASTFPHFLHERISIIHDGIDTDRIRPSDTAKVAIPGTRLAFARGDEVLTFVNRNLEPYRGYHTFMRALPEVLRQRPGAHVVIVGGSSNSYGPKPPGTRSWKDVYLDEVRDRLDMSRVHFVGAVPYATFVDLMRVARVHAYLTYPFVLSWSMLEAMAAGALVVGSRTAPVEEVIRHGENGLLVDFFDAKAWAGTLVEALAEPSRHDALRAAARATVTANYDLRTRCLPALLDLVDTVAAGGTQSASD